MTFAPQTLRDLGMYWNGKKGVNLGIVGDTGHLEKGVSYHLGRSDLLPTAYSIQTVRDRKGLSEAASAIDLGKLNGTYGDLRSFSSWLAQQCLDGARGTIDIREVIFSPDGRKVWGFKDGVDKLIPDYGDDTHLTHTHVSYYRDSENRDKIAVFAPYFEEVPVLDFAWIDGQPDSGRGTVTVQGSGHSAILADGTLYPLNDQATKPSYGLVQFLDGKWKGLFAYAIGTNCAWLLKKDVTYKADPATGGGDIIRTVTVNAVVGGSIKGTMEVKV